MNVLRQTILKANYLLNQGLFTNSVICRTFSILSEKRPIIHTPLLQSVSPLVQQTCGFKVKYKLQKRCKDCLLVVRDGRKYIICPTHPRHKQMSMIKKPRYTWILTHASQSKIRPW